MIFEENVTVTFLLIRLPDGKQIRAAIDDAAAAAVVGLSVVQNGQPRSAVRPSSAESVPEYRPAAEPEPAGFVEPPLRNVKAQPLPTAEDEPAPRIFGGQDGGDDADPGYVSDDEPVPAQPAARSNMQRTRGGKIVVPSRTVPMSNFGYPVVQSNGVAPESITSNSNTNDDGVGSI
jgi:hypothetical protein